MHRTFCNRVEKETEMMENIKFDSIIKINLGNAFTS